jgi:small conductance mechanosensitive channel
MIIRMILRNMTGLLMLLATFACLSAYAQDAGESTELKPLTEETTAAFDAILSEIALSEADIERQGEAADASEGVVANIQRIRHDRLWTATFNQALDLAEQIANERDQGTDVSAYVGPIARKLQEMSSETQKVIDRLSDRIEFPSSELPPEQFVVKDQQLFRHIHDLDVSYGALIRHISLADRLGIDVVSESEFMSTKLQEAAASRSIFLEMAMDDVTMLRSSTATLPGNTDLADWLRAAETRVALTAAAMQEIVSLMGALGLESRVYRKQVLSVTGEITTDVLDVNIAANLISDWTDSLTEIIATSGLKFIFRLLIVIVIVIAFYYIAKIAQKGVERALNSNRVHVSRLLQRMIIAIVRNIVIMIGFLVVLGQLGVSLGPLLAGFGVMGLIIGIALQDTLSNFASGIMILLYRPFDVGDIVKAADVQGRVSHMSLVNTTFMTLDNQKLIVPNNRIWGSVITNVTAQRTRRIDLVFDVSYDDDIEKVAKALKEIVDEHEAVLADPEPIIALSALADSSVQFILRPWVKTDDYWDTYWDLMKKVKLKFDEEGISIPYPHRSILITEKE